jgi:hypothetical protein
MLLQWQSGTNEIGKKQQFKMMARLTKSQDNETASWQNGNVIKWQVDKMSG